MSDFCDFVPDDPQCQPVDPPKPDPISGDGGDMSDDDMDGDMGDMIMEMRKAQVTYLMVPLMGLISTAAWKFRYSTATGISEIGDTAATTNYW